MGKVNVSLIRCRDNSYIGVAELDNPEALNALSKTMIEQLYNSLLDWQTDDRVVAVFLHAKGEKAFCAGGDIQAIYQVLKNRESEPEQAQQVLEDFFTLEYRCDHLIHTYSKPVIAWGHGYLMGGGVGLFMGASQRIVASNTRFAMPEVKIGLYPDVGATYFLNKLPQHFALFISLTSAQINADDMKALGLCQWVSEPDNKSRFVNELLNIEWGSQTDLNETIGSILSEMESGTLGAGLMMPFREQIEHMCAANSLSAMVDRILSADIENKWFNNAQRALAYGSPLSMQISYRQLTQYRTLSLDACFALEYGLTIHCGMEGDFREGVRSLVIDKSNDPNWLYTDISSVPNGLLDRFFSPICSPQELLY